MGPVRHGSANHESLISRVMFARVMFAEVPLTGLSFAIRAATEKS
jgi:hypothetical protein